jgi:repressor LexA
MTGNEAKVLKFLRNYIKEEGHPPSYQEICQFMQLKSVNSIQQYLKQLERKGYLTSPWKNQKRALRLTAAEKEKNLALPLLGSVAAGSPIEELAHHESVDVPESLLGRGENFALRVKGNSMIEDGIHDGDTVIVKKQSQALNGQTIVALMKNEATIKRFYQKGDRIVLQPANSQMKPIQIEGGDFTIVGVVIGLIRRYP